MLADAEEGTELPLVPVATTVNVYAVLEERPDTVTGLDEPVPVSPPGDDVATYVAAVTFVGATKETLADPKLCIEALTDVGAFGIGEICDQPIEE